MDKKAIDILTNRFKCSDCGEWKLGTEFRRSSNKGPKAIENQCKLCRKIREAKSRPTCKECKKVKKLNKNNLCFGCNRKFGLKQCSQCKELLMLFTDYQMNKHGAFSRKCKYCTGKWKKEPELMALEDWPILIMKE